MSNCQECGGPTVLKFPLCRACFTRHRTATDPTASVRPSVAKGTPLEVSCDYVYPTYVEERTNGCEASAGQPCRFSRYVPFLDMRVVQGDEWRVEVHETRFRKWRSPVIV